MEAVTRRRGRARTTAFYPVRPKLLDRGGLLPGEDAQQGGLAGTGETGKPDHTALLLDGLLNRQVPALRTFQNLEMKREFEKLTAQLRTEEGA